MGDPFWSEGSSCMEPTFPRTMCFGVGKRWVVGHFQNCLKVLKLCMCLQGVGEDVFMWLSRNMRRQISIHVDGGVHRYREQGTQQHKRNGHNPTNKTELKMFSEGVAQGYCLSPTQPQLELGVKKLLGWPPTPHHPPTQHNNQKYIDSIKKKSTLIWCDIIIN